MPSRSTIGSNIVQQARVQWYTNHLWLYPLPYMYQFYSKKTRGSNRIFVSISLYGPWISQQTVQTDEMPRSMAFRLSLHYWPKHRAIFWPISKVQPSILDNSENSDAFYSISSESSLMAQIQGCTIVQPCFLANREAIERGVNLLVNKGLKTNAV